MRCKALWTLVSILSITGGCAANTGARFNADVINAVPDRHARVVVYPAGQVDDAIYFYTYVDGKRMKRVFSDTFAILDVDSGDLDIEVEEWWTGKGLGKEFGEIFTKPLADPVSNLPESLNAGTRTRLTIRAQTGDVIYLRIAKLPGKEVFYECEDTKETTVMCSRLTFPTSVEQVSKVAAAQDLQGRSESL